MELSKSETLSAAMTLSTFGTQGRHMPLHRCQPPHRRPPPGADPPHPAHEAATSQAVGATPRNLNPTPSQSQGQCQRQRQRSRSWQSGKIGYLGDVELLSITNPYPVYMAFDAVRPASSQEGARASDYQESSSPEPREDGTNPPSRHRRGYQACQHCRDRKVKCDLGSMFDGKFWVPVPLADQLTGVDAPHSPPCARCKRERLECQFAPTRKKLKRGGEETGEGRPGHGPKRRTYSTSQSEVKAFSPHGLQQPLRGFATANDFAPHPRWPGPPNHPTPSQSPQPHHETSAAAAFGRDAHLAGHKLQDVPSNSGRGSDVSVEVHSQIAAATFRSAVSSTQDNIMLLVDAANALPEDPGSTVIGRSLADRAGRARAISGLRPGAPSATPQTTLTPQEQEDQEQGLKAWSRMRFVRAGWFTASEAIQYVEYFYDRLAPMTPVVTRDFRSPAKHLALLTEEPVLALAILAIASRCMRLSGSAAVSRSYHIHDKLWTSLRSTVQRLLWGQEQLGGGFGGGGAAKMRQSNGGQFTWRGSLRTLGTIEALLLLTDWQPRALHFPPSDDDTRLLDDGSPDPLLDPNGSATMHDDDLAGGPSDTHDSLPYASWLEPAWRCDRMSLMLLGLAQALAFELGVFDTSHYGCQHQHGPGSDCVRKRRIRRLLLVYIAQTCGRMGIQSMIKVSEWENDPVFDQPSKEQGYGQAEEEDAVDIMQGCWLHIAGILEKANRDVFSSRQYTRELTSSGAYKKSISLFSGLLQEWKQHFDQVASRISPVMQSILLMEYQYSRLYINSLGLQNVVESWIEHGSNMPTTTLVKIVEDNKLYIDEVTDAALTILSLVVDGLAAKGHLRDAPIRIYLRSLSGMMFTLKVRASQVPVVIREADHFIFSPAL